MEVDVFDSVAVGDVGEGFAVGAPGWALFVEGVVGEGDGGAADGHDVKLVEGYEGDLRSVGGEGGGIDAFDCPGRCSVEVELLALEGGADGWDGGGKGDGGFGLRR